MNRPTRFARPTVVVSACLKSARCRWDGDTIRFDLLSRLARYARLISICPEVEIGLGVPRDKIILVDHKPSPALYQPSSGKRLTVKMNRWSRTYLHSLNRVDGFLLKHKSPSCGLRGVKLYEGLSENSHFVRSGTGLFAAEIAKRFPNYPCEDEVSIESSHRRELFFTRLFALAALAEATAPGNRLNIFHERYRLLLSTHSARATAEAKKLLAGHQTVQTTWAYSEAVRDILRLPPRRGSVIRQYEAALDHYRPGLSRSDVHRFERLACQYLAGTVALSELRKLVQIWAVRYDKSFIRSDAVYRPYPQALAITD